MSRNLSRAIAVIGIDIGKNSFHVVGFDERGAIALRQKWSRDGRDRSPVRRSSKVVTSPPGWASCQSRCRPAIVQSSARYPSGATAIYAFSSCKQRGSC